MEKIRFQLLVMLSLMMTSVFGQTQGEYLVVSTNTMTFSSAANSQKFNINSNASWTIESSESWLTVTPTSGSNDKEITVKAAENKSDKDRTATITVTRGDGTVTITITVAQHGNSGSATESPLINEYVKDSTVFDLTGKSVKRSSHGLHVIRGKKVIRK